VLAAKAHSALFLLSRIVFLPQKKKEVGCFFVYFRLRSTSAAATMAITVAAAIAMYTSVPIPVLAISSPIAPLRLMPQKAPPQQRQKRQMEKNPHFESTKCTCQDHKD
jgi:hypothetical protein